MPDFCTLTGIVRRPDGTPFASGTLDIRRHPSAVISRGGVLTVPVRTVVQTAGDGAASITLQPGNYAGVGHRQGERLQFVLGVPDQTTAVLADWLSVDSGVLTSFQDAMIAERNATATLAGKTLTSPVIDCTITGTAVVGGTVSQTLGVPTGALMQHGSSANGFFERRASGRAVCTRTDQTTPDASTAYGSLFRSADIVWTFPTAFFAGTLPGVSFSADNSDVLGFRTISPSKPAVTFQLVANASIASAITVRASAQGRWSNMI